MEKPFEKQIKIIEDQGQKQVEALKDLKPEGQTKAIKIKPEERAKIIFNDLIILLTKEKNIE